MDKNNLCSNIKLPGNLTNETLSLNIPNTFEEVFKDCGKEGALNDFYDSMSQTVASIAPNQINKFIDPENQEDKELSLRPGLKQPFKDGGAMMGKNLKTFALDLGNKMTCENVNMMYYDVKESICCGVFNGLFKLIGGITCLTLLAIFCGCPGGIRGYKHFLKDETVKEWHYEKRKLYGLEDDDSDEEEFAEDLEGGGVQLQQLSANPMLGYTNVTSWDGAGPLKSRK